MSPPTEPAKPVVEKNGNDREAAELTARSLQLRIRQQEILAELGVLALQRTTFAELLESTARLMAEGLHADYCKVLEYHPEENRFLVRAGVGWEEGVVGTATIGADLASPAGYALRTGKPVISNHLENEERFRTPELLAEHGILRAMNVIIQGDGAPYGALEVDSKSDDEFSEHDLAFLQGAANIIGMAIERQRDERKLNDALDRHQLLLKEVNHRVKNSLQVVSSMLHLQAKAAGDPRLSEQLNQASMRIIAVGRAYDRLAYNADYERIELISYLRDVMKDIAAAVSPCGLEFEAPADIQFPADRAILLALIINELASNAAKYAFRDRAAGTIWVKVTAAGEHSIAISVRDDGVGMPASFDSAKSTGLGTRLVVALANQLEAEISRPAGTTGTEVALLVPYERASAR
jgi:two-component sensor histidine kinase